MRGAVNLKKSLRSARLAGLGLIMGGVLATACSSHPAGAFPLVSGPVTITPTTSVPSGKTLQSGQTVNVVVAANTTLDKSSLEAAGFPGGAVSMKAEECDDPGGLVANLPKTSAYNCDGVTVASTALINPDGSFKIEGYTVYSLPDYPTFHESPDTLPKCGSGSNYCVLYIGPDESDLTKPHLFSAPFLVAANSTDSGNAAQGLGSSVSGPGSQTASVAVSSPSKAASLGDDGTLAYTGVPVAWLWIIFLGLFLNVVGAVGRRKFRSRGVI